MALCICRHYLHLKEDPYSFIFLWLERNEATRAQIDERSWEPLFKTCRKNRVCLKASDWGPNQPSSEWLYERKYSATPIPSWATNPIRKNRELGLNLRKFVEIMLQRPSENKLFKWTILSNCWWLLRLRNTTCAKTKRF